MSVFTLIIAPPPSPISFRKKELKDSPWQKLSYLHPTAILQDLVCLGAWVPSKPAAWLKVRKVVAGRVVNGYSRHDALLENVYFRLSLFEWARFGGPSGLRPVGLNHAAPARAAGSSPAPAAQPSLLRSFQSLVGGGGGKAAEEVESSDDETTASGEAYDPGADVDDRMRVNGGMVELPPSYKSGRTTFWCGVENVDLSHLVQNSHDWEKKLEAITLFLSFFP